MHDDLGALEVRAPRKHMRHGIEHAHFFGRDDGPRHGFEEGHGRFQPRRFRAQRGFENEGRKARRAPLFELRLGKAGEVMAREGGKERMARIAGLDEHLAGTLPAPGASGDLSKHRKQPLGCPVVGRNERRIRVQHGDQRERREVMSLCEELRTDQNVSFALPDVLQRAHKIGSTPCAVAVDAHDPRAGKKRGQCLFYALRAASHRP